MNLSVIIPVAPNDDDWKILLSDLQFLSEEDECIFVSPHNIKDELSKYKFRFKITWIYSDLGRARQLNTGARDAKNDFFWFVHCDSRISLESLSALKNEIKIKPNKLYFFDLKFISDGPLLMVLNELGVFIRAKILKIPFGDQAFCMNKEIFFKLGQFDENAVYGEDHLLIWKAHQKKVAISSIGKSIYTSSRRYKKYGWLFTTTDHLWKTFKQGFPQFLILVNNSLKRPNL